MVMNATRRRFLGTGTLATAAGLFRASADHEGGPKNKRIVKLDVKDWGVKTGWAKIGAGDVDWADVRKALAETGFTGWVTAEVGGGNRARCAEILANMQTHILGA